MFLKWFARAFVAPAAGDVKTVWRGLTGFNERGRGLLVDGVKVGSVHNIDKYMDIYYKVISTQGARVLTKFM
jgi:hypothetical protein